MELYESMVDEMNRQDIDAFEDSDFALKSLFRLANSNVFD